MADNAGVTTSTTPNYPALTMLFVTFAFILPVVAFPLTDIMLRAIWAGRPASTLPFPPVLLSMITGGSSIAINYGFIIFGYTGADYLYFTCANISYVILFLFGSSFYLSI
jgi:hypothetical protein